MSIKLTKTEKAEKCKNLMNLYLSEPEDLTKEEIDFLCKEGYLLDPEYCTALR